MHDDNIIFLAYAREDKRSVKQLYNTLRKAGLNLWMDQEDLNPGENWIEKTDGTLKRSRFFLACLSGQSVSKSGYGQRELRLALSELEKKPPGRRWFIPVLLEDIELPELTVGTIRLRDYQAVKIFEEKGLQKLIDLLKTPINKESMPSGASRVATTTDAEKPQKSLNQPEQKAMDKGSKKKEDPIQNIQDYVAEDRMDKALKLLKDHIRNQHPEWDSDVILLSSRYSNLEKQRHRGIINQEQYLLEKNRITHAILELAGRLK